MSGQMRFVQIGVAVELYGEIPTSFRQASSLRSLQKRWLRSEVVGALPGAAFRLIRPAHAGIGFGPDELDTIACELSAGGADDVERPFEREVAAFVKIVDHKLTGWRVVAGTAFVDTSGRLWGSPRPNDQRQERYPHPWRTFREQLVGRCGGRPAEWSGLRSLSRAVRRLSGGHVRKMRRRCWILSTSLLSCISSWSFSCCSYQSA